MPHDELPTEVLTELGRVTWAAIRLDDYADSLCASVESSHAGGRSNRRHTGQKINDALLVLAGWPASLARDEAAGWLGRAQEALDRRHATLHGTPLVWFAPGRPDDGQQLLGEMPRPGRPYRERPLTVESLAELSSALVEAAGGWRDVTLAVSAEAERQRRTNTANPPS